MWLIKHWVQTVRDWQQQWAAEGGRWIGKMDFCDEVKKCEGMMWMLPLVCVSELLSLLVPRVHLFSQMGLSLSDSLSSSPLPLLCISLLPLLSSPVPPGLVEQWADMSLFLSKSNWRQAFIGMTWRWVAKSFQPLLLEARSPRRTALHTDAAAAAAAAAETGSALKRAQCSLS